MTQVHETQETLFLLQETNVFATQLFHRNGKRREERKRGFAHAWRGVPPELLVLPNGQLQLAGPSHDEHLTNWIPLSPTTDERQKLPFPPTNADYLANWTAYAGSAFERLIPQRGLDGAYIR